MANRREEGVAVGTDAGLRNSLAACAFLLALAQPEGARGKPPSDDAAILAERHEGAHIDELRLRMTSYYQDGHGYQSQAGPLIGPGSERALIVQPMILVGIRQSARIHHELVVPVDIVSAASTNGVDVVSHASGVNEAVGVEWTTRFDASHEDQITTRLAWHEEEPFGSGAFALGYTRSLAEDNASLGISGQATFDRFDFLQPNGDRYGRRNRTSLNGNLSFSQLLSATSVFDASYGLTFQQGTLQTTYDSVPLVGGRARAVELFPRSRTRHALQARLAQHLPGSRTTLRAAYRYYWDSFELTAQSVELEVYQYLARRFVLRASYRYYTQTGVDFFASAFPSDIGPAVPRTSDSDLAPFHAHEPALKLLWLAPGLSTLDVSYVHYARSNGLFANIVSFGYGERF